MAGPAGLERSVDELIRDLNDKYGYLCKESPIRSKVMSPQLPLITPFDIPELYMLSQSAPVSPPPISPVLRNGCARA